MELGESELMFYTRAYLKGEEGKRQVKTKDGLTTVSLSLNVFVTNLPQLHPGSRSTARSRFPQRILLC